MFASKAGPGVRESHEEAADLRFGAISLPATHLPSPVLRTMSLPSVMSLAVSSLSLRF